MGRKSTPAGECEEDKLLNWIEVLRRSSVARSVMVQHKRDADVLKSLHVQHVFYEQEPDFKVIDGLSSAGRECLLIYDATRPGNAACARMRAKLERQGVKVSTRMRKILFTAGCKELGGFLKYVYQVLGTERKHAGMNV